MLPKARDHHETSQHHLREYLAGDQMGRSSVGPVFGGEIGKLAQGGLAEDFTACLFNSSQTQDFSGRELQTLGYP